MRQLVEIADEALHARVDQFLGHSVGAASRVHQAGDVVERAAVARANERRAHRFAAAAHREQHFDQAQHDEFLAGHHDVGAARAARVRTEKVIWLVDRVRPAGDDQRAMRGIDPVRVADQVHALLGMQAHARDHEQVGDPAVQSHSRRPEVAVPLLQDDPRLFESGIHHRRADGADTRRRHPRIGEDERQHPRAVIKGAGDDRRQVVSWRNCPQALSETGQFARLEQFVSTRASGKLHGGPLQNNVKSPQFKTRPQHNARQVPWRTLASKALGTSRRLS